MNRPTPVERTAEEAINTVLDAERQARQAIDGCAREAEALLAAARAEARRINARRDGRLAALVARCERITDLQLARVAADERALPDTIPEERRRQALAEAVERVAARLAFATAPADESA